MPGDAEEPIEQDPRQGFRALKEVCAGRQDFGSPPSSPVVAQGNQHLYTDQSEDFFERSDWPVYRCWWP